MLKVFSIRTKITLCFLALVIVINGVFALASYFRIINAIHAEIQKHGIGVVKILSQMAAPYIFESDYATIIDIADKLTRESEAERFAIVDVEGRIWLATHPEQESIHIDDPFYASIIQDNTVDFREIKRQEGRVMEFVSPINALGNVMYLLKIEMSLETVRQEALQRFHENLIIGLVMVIFATLLAVILGRVLTAPLKILVQGTRELSQGNLSHRIAVQSSDETGELSESFNLMAADLEKELAVRREAEAKLVEYSNKLEETVAKRTALLTETNNSLFKEVEDHKQTEIALVESRERYKRFSEVTLDAIVFHNEDGIVDANTSFSTMFGYSSDSFIGKNLINIICPITHREAVHSRLAADPSAIVDTIGRKENGETLPIEMQSRTLLYNDKTLTVTSIRDTTKRTKLEHQLQQAQRMEGIGRLAAGIAHDLNNILSGVVTMPQLLLLDLPADSPLKEHLESIQNSGESAAVIVQDMLTLAGSSLNIEKVLDPVSLVRSYILSPESMKLKQTHPGIAIELAIGKGIQNIKGSPVHLNKALMNLVKNGADAIEGVGKVIIGVENVHVDTPFGGYETIPVGDYVCISITDTGTGISSENIPFVFEPFYTKKVLGRSGTGLGMVIVWNTIKDHSGFIDITSGIGVGTEVSIYLPVTDDAYQEQEKDPTIDSLRGELETILVVDDIEEQRVIASSILERLNYKVRSVPGGEEAVAFLQKEAVDLILLDMIMDPGISGLETCKRIFSLYPQTKIVIASGYAESGMVQESLRLGARQYIKKPYSITTLGATIKEALIKK